MRKLRNADRNANTSAELHSDAGPGKPRAVWSNASTPSSSKGYWARFWDCMNDNRFDNLLRDIERSAGHPGLGEFAGDLTVTGTVVAAVNQGLNLTSLGKYPRGGIAEPAGSPTVGNIASVARLRER